MKSTKVYTYSSPFICPKLGTPNEPRFWRFDIRDSAAPSVGGPNSPAFLFPRTLWIDLGVILVPTALITFAAMWMDLDLDVARKITDRKSNLGELGFELALMSYVTGGLLLIPMCVPAVRRHWPTFVRSSAVFILSMIIGVMGFVQNTKLELHRPRPMEVKELGGRYTFTAPFGSDPACAQCTSFPSSSAGSAFLVATPFFVLRRRHKALALVFLVAGVGWGSFIGYTRMVPGLHWLTDILWSAAFVFVTASALSHVGVAWRSFGAPDRDQR